MAFLLTNSLKISLGKELVKAYCLQVQQLQQKGLRTTRWIFNPHKQHPDTKTQNDAPKKHKEVPKITLIQNENITVTALEDAKNLAKRRSMHLIKVQDMDTKTQRPVYKLLTATEMIQNELSDITNSSGGGNSSGSAAKKPQKLLTIGSRIAEHDLSSRLKNISKWLNKQHEVRVLIQASSEQDLAKCETLFKSIEEFIKTPQVIGKIVQKHNKNNVIKFSILPVTTAIKDESSSNSQ